MAMQQRPQGRAEAMTKTPRFADILSIAYEQHGLKRVSTAIVQLPNEENRWTTIVHATVEVDRGEFSAIGDANPENSGRLIAPHSVRFAESRAIARALRWATNAGEAIDVEMGDFDPFDKAPEYPQEQQTRPTPVRTATAPPPDPTQRTQPPQVDETWQRVVKAQQALASVGVEIDLPPKTIDLDVWLKDAEQTYRNAKQGARV